MTSARVAALACMTMAAVSLAGCATTGKTSSVRTKQGASSAMSAAQPVDGDIRKILAAGGVDPGHGQAGAPAAAPAASAQASGTAFPSTPGAPTVTPEAPLPAQPTPPVAQAPLGQQVPVGQPALAPAAPAGLASNTARAAAPQRPAARSDFMSFPGDSIANGILPPPPVAPTQVTVITGPDAAPRVQPRRDPAPRPAPEVAEAPRPRVIEPQAPVQASSLPTGYQAPERKAEPAAQEVTASRRF